MVGDIPNRSGWRCEACGKAPPSWWAVACPRGCGHQVMACGRCASRASIEDAMDVHLSSCGHELSGPEPAHLPTVRRDLMRAGARVGATMGRARGPDTTLAGGAIGAALGALAGHILRQPHLRPLVEVVQDLRDPVVEAIKMIRGAGR